MESGKDTRWMMHRWNPDNVIPLTDMETNEILEKVKHFEQNLKQLELLQKVANFKYYYEN